MMPASHLPDEASPEYSRLDSPVAALPGAAALEVLPSAEAPSDVVWEAPPLETTMRADHAATTLFVLRAGQEVERPIEICGQEVLTNLKEISLKTRKSSKTLKTNGRIWRAMQWDDPPGVGASTADDAAIPSTSKTARTAGAETGDLIFEPSDSVVLTTQTQGQNV